MRTEAFSGDRRLFRKEISRQDFQPVFDIRHSSAPGTPESDFDRMPRQEKENFIRSLRLFGVSLLGAKANYRETIRFFRMHKELLRV